MKQESIHLYNQWAATHAQSEMFNIVERQKKHLQDTFFECMDGLLSEYRNLQRLQKKGTLTYIAISFLRTGLSLRRCTHRIDLFDEQYFLDWEECGSYWDLSVLYQPFYSQISQLQPALSKPDRNTLELEEHSLCSMVDFNPVIVDAIVPILQSYLRTGQSRNMLEKHSVKFAYGEFLDRMRVIYRAGE